MPYTYTRKFNQVFGMIETVRKNLKKFTEKEVEKVNLSRKAQEMVAHLSDNKFKEIESRNNIKKILLKSKMPLTLISYLVLIKTD